MHILVNAVPIRPGGGLTVIRGLLQGLHLVSDEALRVTVLVGATDTAAIIKEQGLADVVEVCHNRSVVVRQLWQNFRLGGYIKQQGVDVLLTVNHFVPRVDCPQVVYHLNLSRFIPLPDGLSFWNRLAEKRRNYRARQALRHAEANVFESAYLRDAAENAVPESRNRNQVVYIGLPDSDVAGSPDIKPSGLHGPRIVAITSPLAHKDIPTTIQTLATLINRHPEVRWTLDVAGGRDVSAWESTRELAKSLKVAERITWHGFLNPNQLDALLRQSLCLISTSVVESFCMVALESMARGCPPVVTTAASMPESVGDAAILCSPHDHQGFANEIASLYKNPADRELLVEQGYKHIQRFRWSICGEQFHDIFQSLCQN